MFPKQIESIYSGKIRSKFVAIFFHLNLTQYEKNEF